MLKKVCFIFLLVICLTFSACGGASEATDGTSVKEQTAKIKVDPDAPRYQLKSILIDWETEFAVTHTNVEHFSFLHGTHALTTVEVVNTGEHPINMSDLAWNKYTLEDKDGTQEDTYFDYFHPVIIFPGETGYISGYASTFGTWDKPTDLKLLLDFDLNANVVLQGSKLDEFCDIFEVSDGELSIDDNGNAHYSGSVTNHLKEAVKNVYISVVLLDQDNHPLCVVFDMLDLDAGETAAFDATATTYASFDLSDISDYEVLAYHRR